MLAEKKKFLNKVNITQINFLKKSKLLDFFFIIFQNKNLKWWAFIWDLVCKNLLETSWNIWLCVPSRVIISNKKKNFAIKQKILRAHSTASYTLIQCPKTFCMSYLHLYKTCFMILIILIIMIILGILEKEHSLSAFWVAPKSNSVISENLPNIALHR